MHGMRVSATKPTTKGLYIERKNGVARKVWKNKYVIV